MYFKSSAIILKNTTLKEADNIVALLTYNYGKIEAVCRGAKKVKSKLSGHLDYFCLADVVIAAGKNKNHISGALMKEDFNKIKKDIFKINAGFYFLEILNQFVKIEKPDKHIFQLCYSFLKFLNDADNKNYILLITWSSILKLLSFLGYYPELDKCSYCGRGEVFSFDISVGAVCSVCGGASAKINLNSLKMMSLLIKNEFADILRIKYDKYLFSETIKLIDNFMLYRMDRNLKSRKFL